MGVNKAHIMVVNMGVWNGIGDDMGCYGELLDGMGLSVIVSEWYGMVWLWKDWIYSLIWENLTEWVKKWLLERLKTLVRIDDNVIIYYDNERSKKFVNFPATLNC